MTPEPSDNSADQYPKVLNFLALLSIARDVTRDDRIRLEAALTALAAAEREKLIVNVVNYADAPPWPPQTKLRAPENPRRLFVECLFIDSMLSQPAIEAAAQVLAKIRQDEIEIARLFEGFGLGGATVEHLLDELDRAK